MQGDLSETLSDDLFLTDEAETGARTLSFRRSPTVLLSFAANRFTRAAAREYQARFGIGAMDWRMLVMLTREPGSTVSHSGRTIGIDKAAVSRSLRRLEAQGLAAPDTVRSTEWHLTAAGHALHAEILEVALARQQRLLQGLSAEEVETFNRCLRVFLDNLDGLQAEN
ncbi:MAG: MarR family winged helix-turn-helix transcriptional regulator [Paracoccaceae bacterium]